MNIDNLNGKMNKFAKLTFTAQQNTSGFTHPFGGYRLNFPNDYTKWDGYTDDITNIVKVIPCGCYQATDQSFAMPLIETTGGALWGVAKDLDQDTTAAVIIVYN